MRDLHAKIIEAGIIFLLIYTPLAFGGVTELSRTLIELVTALLLLVWLAWIFSKRQRASRRSSRRSSRHVEQPQNDYHLTIMPFPFTIALVLFFGFIGLQLIPLPAVLVKLIAPNTYQVYLEGALQTTTPIPRLIPLSLSTQATEKELLLFLAYAALFFLTMNTMRSTQQMKRLMYIMIAIGCFESFYGLAQFFTGQPLIHFYKRHPSAWITGTFVNKNHVAGYIEMVIPLVLGVMLVQLEHRSGAPGSKLTRFLEEKYLKVVLLFFLVSLLIGAQLLTGSRGGLLSFSAGIVFFALLAYTRRILRKRVFVILMLLFLIPGIAVVVSPDAIMQRLSVLTGTIEEDLAVQFRWEAWKSTLTIFRDFPLFGSGFGTFAQVIQRYQTFPSYFVFEYAENDYLQLLAETGIVGTILVFWMGGVFFYRTLSAWKQRHSRWPIAMVAGGLSAMFGIVIHSWVDFNLHIPSNAILFTVIAALSYVTASTHKQAS